jgi:transcriptional regulator with XRE-family HTH domain
MPLPVPKKKYERLRVLLVEAREEAGLTQVELGKRLRRPQAFVSKIERGLRRVDVLEFLEIARAVGFDPHELISRLNSKST